MVLLFEKIGVFHVRLFIDVDGEGPGDGRKRLFVTKVEIPTKDGVIKTVYLKKAYYENATPKQIEAMSRKAVTPNGWCLSTAAEYEQFQKDPNQGAFSSRVLGADTPKKYREFGEYSGGIFDGTQPLYVRGARTGTLEIETSGSTPSNDEEGAKTLTQTFKFSIHDADGNVISSNTKTITGEGKVTYDYNLGDGQYITILNESDEKASSYSTGVYTKEKKGEKRIDTMDKYGELPNEDDIKAVSN